MPTTDSILQHKNVESIDKQWANKDYMSSQMLLPNFAVCLSNLWDQKREGSIQTNTKFLFFEKKIICPYKLISDATVDLIFQHKNVESVDKQWVNKNQCQVRFCCKHFAVPLSNIWDQKRVGQYSN